LGGTRKLPYAFTENGVAMLSSVLNSKLAIHVNIQIMRTFTRLREILLTHKDLARKLAYMEKKYDSQFKVVFDAIRQLMSPVVPKKGKIGFGRDKDDRRVDVTSYNWNESGWGLFDIRQSNIKLQKPDNHIKGTF